MNNRGDRGNYNFGEDNDKTMDRDDEHLNIGKMQMDDSLSTIKFNKSNMPYGLRARQRQQQE